MDPAAEQLSQLLLPSLSPLTLVVERGEFSKGDLQAGPFAPPQGVALTVKQ